MGSKVYACNKHHGLAIETKQKLKQKNKPVITLYKPVEFSCLLLHIGVISQLGIHLDVRVECGMSPMVAFLSPLV